MFAPNLRNSCRNFACTSTNKVSIAVAAAAATMVAVKAAAARPFLNMAARTSMRQNIDE
jgi:hypothetical protein